MIEKIRVLMPSQVPSLADDVNLSSIKKELNSYAKEIEQKINTKDLYDWRLSISILSLPTNGIGILKRARRYPSDKEFEISIAMSIPNNVQTHYGLLNVKNGFYAPLNEKHYILEPHYENYENLYDYILESSKRAIDFIFTKGIVCGGEKIKFLGIEK